MRTRYTTCISVELGGSGNPSVATGQGKHFIFLGFTENICNEKLIIAYLKQF